MKTSFFRWAMLALIMLFWFSVSFITNILGPVIPDIMHGFHLTDLTMAGFIPTFFFIAYALMSIPSGILIDRYGEKTVLVIGFLISFIGALLFAVSPSYKMLLTSCFIMGAGMAMLQTVLNPLQRAVGGEENYAFVAEVAQLMFGIASFISPLIYVRLVSRLSTPITSDDSFLIHWFRRVTPPDLPWVSLYWIFVVLLGVLTLIVMWVRFPRVETAASDVTGSSMSYHQLFRKPIVWLYFLGIFAYVSSEQSLSIFMSTFLERYHAIDPRTVGADCVSRFWGLMTVGCIVGMVLLKFVDSRRILILSGAGALVLLVLGLFGHTAVAIQALPAIGFFASMMYSVIFSLALNSVRSHHGSFAGILCTAIVGGAIGPLSVSVLSDLFSLRMSLMLVFLFLAYITSIGFWARPLVHNKTWSLRRLLRKKS